MSTVLQIAIEKGTDFLLASQEPDGSWCADFGFRHGPAQAWTTAWVGNRLPKIFRSALEKARNFLISRMQPHPDYGKGWGYNDRVVSDLDSTLETARFLHNWGDTLVSLQNLRGIQHADGGFGTYTLADATTLRPGKSVEGWVSSHPEIATNLRKLVTLQANEPGAGDLLATTEQYILSHIRENGYRNYWYWSPVTAAAFAIESGISLSQLPPLPIPTSEAELDWELCHHPLVTAMAVLAIELMRDSGYDRVGEAMIDCLINSQRPDGSWRALPVLGVPYHDAVDSRFVQHINADYGKPLLTTSSVIYTLNTFQRRTLRLAA